MKRPEEMEILALITFIILSFCVYLCVDWSINEEFCMFEEDRIFIEEFNR